MGYRQTYKCNQCGYTVMTSAGPDGGMLAFTDTYYCVYCDEIVDVLIGHHGMSDSDDDSESSRKKYKKCPICGKAVHFKWDITVKLCPKCPGKMKIDPEGRHVRWD